MTKREQICQLEDGHKAFAFSTGMAALSAVTRLVRAGQEIILNNDSYGGTYRLLSKVKTPSLLPPAPPRLLFCGVHTDVPSNVETLVSCPPSLIICGVPSLRILSIMYLVFLFLLRKPYPRET